MFSGHDREGMWTDTDTVWIKGGALLPKSLGSFSNIIIKENQRRHFLFTYPGKVSTCPERLTFPLGSKSLSVAILLMNLENSLEELSSEKIHSVNIL